MTQPPSISYETVPQRSVDDGHLQALSVCHYVWGGMTLLFSCFFIFYIVLGVAFISGRMAAMQQPNMPPAQQPPAFFGYFFVLFGIVMLLLGWTLGGLTIYSGRCIAKRTRHTFSLVVAGFNCMAFPIGTTLGVFTFVVLLRQSVRPLFAER